MRHADGRWLWFETRGRGFQTSSGDVHYVGHTRDITEQRESHRSPRAPAPRGPRDRGDSRACSFTWVRRSWMRGWPKASRAWSRSPEQIAHTCSTSLDSRAWSFRAANGRNPRSIAQSAEEDSGSRDPIQVGDRSPREGEVLQLSDASVLDGDAEAVGADLVSRGVRSLLGIPILSDGRLMGYLGVEYLNACREWTDREKSRKCECWPVSSLARCRGRRAERALAEQLEFERRISELSQQLLGVSSEGLEEAITGMLAAVGDLAEVDRAFLLSFPVDSSGSPGPATSSPFNGVRPGSRGRRSNPRSGSSNSPSPRTCRRDRSGRAQIPDEQRAAARATPEPRRDSRFSGCRSRRRVDSRGSWGSRCIGVRGAGERSSGACSGFSAELDRQRAAPSPCRASTAREPTAADARAEDGRRGHAGRRHCPRLQQPPHGDPRLQRVDAARSSRKGIASAEEAEAIARAAKRAAALTSQLLTFSRRQSSLAQPADLAAKSQRGCGCCWSGCWGPISSSSSRRRKSAVLGPWSTRRRWSRRS